MANVSLGSVLRDLATAVPSSIAATYHLLAKQTKRENDIKNFENSCQPVDHLLSPDTSAALGQVKQKQICNDHHQSHLQPSDHRQHQQRQVANEMETSYFTNTPKASNSVRHNLQRAQVAPLQVHKVVKTSVQEGQVAVTLADEATKTMTLPRHPEQTATLERRKLQKPRLAPPLDKIDKRHNEYEQGRNTPSQWQLDNAALLLTSVCGELPIRVQQNGRPNSSKNNSNASENSQQRLAASTPTPPSSMQMSQMVPKQGDTSTIYSPSPRVGQKQGSSEDCSLIPEHSVPSSK